MKAGEFKFSRIEQNWMNYSNWESLCVCISYADVLMLSIMWKRQMQMKPGNESHQVYKYEMSDSIIFLKILFYGYILILSLIQSEIRKPFNPIFCLTAHQRSVHDFWGLPVAKWKSFKVQKHTGPVEEGWLYSPRPKSDSKSHCRATKMSFNFCLQSRG